MVPAPGLGAGVVRPPLDHAIGVVLPHGLAGERAGLAGRRLEFSGDAGDGDVVIKVLLQTVVTGTSCSLPTFS